MEKQKNKRIPMRLTRLQIIGLFVLLATATAIIMFVLGTSDADYKIHQTSLPQALRPTAELLLESAPLYESVQLTDEVSVGLYLLETGDFSAGDTTQTLCFAGYIPEATQYEEYSRIVVNGESISGSFYVAGAGLQLLPRAGYTTLVRCVEGALESGLHLIEFQLRGSSNSEPIATQQWAIEVE